MLLDKKKSLGVVLGTSPKPLQQQSGRATAATLLD
jgi:hypothetical protein